MNNFLDPVELSLASKGLRFANYLIDIIISRLIVFGIFFVLGYGQLIVMDENVLNSLLTLGLEVILIILIYTLQEFLFQGRTIGKFITGTEVVTLEGEKPDFSACLIRSLSRLVPFEPFSFFGETGWHDAWSKTRVVNVKEFEQNRIKFNSIDQIGKPDII